MIRYKAEQIRIPGAKGFGKWYAKMISFNTISTKQLAHELSHVSSATEADVLGVLYALARVIGQHLLDSETVHLEGLGTFRVAMKSHMAERKEDVDNSLIYNYRVTFIPDMVFTQTGIGEKGGRTGFYTKQLIKGVEAKRLLPHPSRQKP